MIPVFNFRYKGTDVRIAAIEGAPHIFRSEAAMLATTGELSHKWSDSTYNADEFYSERGDPRLPLGGAKLLSVEALYGAAKEAHDSGKRSAGPFLEWFDRDVRALFPAKKEPLPVELGPFNTSRVSTSAAAPEPEISSIEEPTEDPVDETSWPDLTKIQEQIDDLDRRVQHLERKPPSLLTRILNLFS